MLLESEALSTTPENLDHSVSTTNFQKRWRVSVLPDVWIRDWNLNTCQWGHIWTGSYILYLWVPHSPIRALFFLHERFTFIPQWMQPRAIWGQYPAQGYLACRPEQPGIQPATLPLVDGQLQPQWEVGYWVRVREYGCVDPRWMRNPSPVGGSNRPHVSETCLVSSIMTVLTSTDWMGWWV